MSLIQLTELSQGESRPLSVNPDHVVSIRPRKVVTVIDAQQDPRSQIAYDGTILRLADGEQHFVAEEFDSVHSLLNSPSPSPSPPAPQQQAPPPEPPKKVSHHKKPEPLPIELPEGALADLMRTSDDT